MNIKQAYYHLQMMDLSNLDEDKRTAIMVALLVMHEKLNGRNPITYKDCCDVIKQMYLDDIITTVEYFTLRTRLDQEVISHERIIR